MADITSIVGRFVTELSSLPSEGGHEAVFDLLEPAINAERELRIQYAQQPTLPYLDAPFLGLINVFTGTLSQSPNARCARPRPVEGPRIGYEFEQGWTHTFPQHYLLPLHPFLRRDHGSPVLVDSLSDFCRNWKIFTHDALSRISDWSNIVVAGGSVLACLSPPLPSPQPSRIAANDFFQSNAYSDSDIDIFLWGLTPQQATAKMEDLFVTIQQALSWRVTCVRKLNTISIHTTYPTRPIQIILRLYRSPAEILAGFDVDSACCLYDGTSVYVNPRALAACIRQANSIDISRRSPSYEVRLAKYADRGFEVFLPTLDRSRLNYEHLYSTELRAFPKGLGRLIVLEFLREAPFHYPGLYRQTTSTITKKPPSKADPSYRPIDFKPIEKTLLKNNYESIWVRIPYRFDWDAERVARLVKTIDSKLNSVYIMSTQHRRLHRHPAFCGTMTQCLSDFCRDCPIPINDEEKELVTAEATHFIRGPVQFIQSNPGRQMISGSFNPLDEDDWSHGAYTDNVCERIVYTHASVWDLDRTGFVNVNPHNPDISQEGEIEETLSSSEPTSVEDLDMPGIVEESEGSSYYTDAFGSEPDLDGF